VLAWKHVDNTGSIEIRVSTLNALGTVVCLYPQYMPHMQCGLQYAMWMTIRHLHTFISTTHSAYLHKHHALSVMALTAPIPPTLPPRPHPLPPRSLTHFSPTPPRSSLVASIPHARAWFPLGPSHPHAKLMRWTQKRTRGVQTRSALTPNGWYWTSA
jgi:hypothetical protein